MRKFRFQFETVLHVRRSREQDALAALAAAQRAYQAEVAAKQGLLGELQRGLERREKLGSVPTPVLSFQLEQEFINGTKSRIVRADQAIVRASRGVEKALRAFLAARKQTRMMEILEEKAYAEFRKELGRRERKELDELMVMRARFTGSGPFGLESESGMPQEESA